MFHSRFALLCTLFLVVPSWSAILCAEKIRLFEEALLRSEKQTLNASTLDDELQTFEREVIEVISSDPQNEVAWANLGKRWELDNDELKTVQAYYRLLRQENSSNYNPTKDLSHLSDLGRKRFFSENPEAKIRYDFYKAQIGKLSVPEIAAHLKMSEIRVRRELSQWQLSVVDSFAGDIGEGTTQASRFVRHYLNIKSRKVSWQRKAKFEGTLLSENEILKILHGRGFDNVQIANRINEIFGMSESDSEYRTAGAVSERKRELELTKQRPHQVKDLELEGYGSVKKAGVLIVESTSKFIFDHRDKGEAWIAAQLSVTLENLRAYNKRHSLSGLFKKNIPEKIQKERESVLEKYATHFIKTEEFLSTHKDLDWNSTTGFSMDKILGYGRYSEGADQAGLKLFDGLPDLYSELQVTTRKALETSTLDAETQKRILNKIETQEKQARFAKLAIDDQRSNVQERLLAHLIAGNPSKLPSSSGPFTKIAGVEYEKWTGQGYYQGKSTDGTALHESPLAAFEELYEYTRNYFETVEIDPKKQEEVLLELESKISFHEKALLKNHEKNTMVFESLYAQLLEKDTFPSSEFSIWSKAIPFSYKSFTNDLNPNSAVAFRRFHRWLKAKLKADGIEAERQKKLLTLSEAKAFDFEFEALSFPEKRKMAAQRIIKHFISKGVFPKSSDLKKETGIGAARFYNYNKVVDEEVLNQNPQVAFELLADELTLQLQSKKISAERREELLRIFESARSLRQRS